MARVVAIRHVDSVSKVSDTVEKATMKSDVDVEERLLVVGVFVGWASSLVALGLAALLRGGALCSGVIP